MAGKITIKLWVHPSMTSVPFKFEPDITIDGNALIRDLMEKSEQAFEVTAEKQGHKLEMQINVLWNLKDQKKALNPEETVGRHFQTGDVFGIYGDVQPAQVNEQKSEEDKIPVTILTGFLGSGKNHSSELHTEGTEREEDRCH